MHLVLGTTSLCSMRGGSTARTKRANTITIADRNSHDQMRHRGHKAKTIGHLHLKKYTSLLDGLDTDIMIHERGHGSNVRRFT